MEPSGANAMALSLSEGHRVQLSYVDAFADGVAVKQVNQLVFCTLACFTSLVPNYMWNHSYYISTIINAMSIYLYF